MNFSLSAMTESMLMNPTWLTVEERLNSMIRAAAERQLGTNNSPHARQVLFELLGADAAARLRARLLRRGSLDAETALDEPWRLRLPYMTDETRHALLDEMELAVLRDVEAQARSADLLSSADFAGLSSAVLDALTERVDTIISVSSGEGCEGGARRDRVLGTALVELLLGGGFRLSRPPGGVAAAEPAVAAVAAGAAPALAAAACAAAAEAPPLPPRGGAMAGDTAPKVQSAAARETAALIRYGYFSASAGTTGPAISAPPSPRAAAVAAAAAAAAAAADGGDPTAGPKLPWLLSLAAADGSEASGPLAASASGAKAATRLRMTLRQVASGVEAAQKMHWLERGSALGGVLAAVVGRALPVPLRRHLWRLRLSGAAVGDARGELPRRLAKELARATARKGLVRPRPRPSLANCLAPSLVTCARLSNLSHPEPDKSFNVLLSRTGLMVGSSSQSCDHNS